MGGGGETCGGGPNTHEILRKVNVKDKNNYKNGETIDSMHLKMETARKNAMWKT